jgi:iron(III) transport system permease protein
MSGAGKLRTIVRVVVPVLTPAALSALLLTVIIVASSFETPVLVGLPGHVGTYMAAIYNAMNSADPDLNLASAQAISYVALTSLLLGWYLLVTRRERRFTSVTGRGAAPRLAPPGVVSSVVAAAVVIHFVLTFVMPVGITVLVSLLPYFNLGLGGPMPALTLDNYREIAADAQNLSALVNSVALSCVAVVVAVGAAFALALISLKSDIRGRRIAEIIGTVPIGVPAIVFSVALLVTFVSVPGVKLLYSTAVPLIVAEMIVFLPFALRILSSALIQIQNDLLEASSISGAGPLQTGRRILLPLMRPALLYAAAAVFVLSFRELSAVILLVTANTTLIPTATFSYWVTGNQGQVAALNIVSLLAPLAVVLVAFALAGGGRRRNGPSLLPQMQP